MSYQKNTNYQDTFIGLAEDREREQRDRMVPLFVSGNPTQQKAATAWLVEYLSEAAPQEGLRLRNRLLARLRGVASVGPTRSITCARALLQLLQQQPRDAAVQALGVAAAQHSCFWEVLCIGVQGYRRSADMFYLSAEALRVAVPLWDTPTAVAHLKQALKPREESIDSLGYGALLQPITDLAPHPALRVLLPDLRALERRGEHQALCRTLCERIEALPDDDLPLPATSPKPRERDLPRPAQNRDSGHG